MQGVNFNILMTLNQAKVTFLAMVSSSSHMTFFCPVLFVGAKTGTSYLHRSFFSQFILS